MAAEASRAPVPVRERPKSSAIEWVAPTINNLKEALDQLCCLADRLGVVHKNNVEDLLDHIERLPNGDSKNSLYRVWMVAEFVEDEIDELREIIAAVTEKAYEDRRAVAA